MLIWLASGLAVLVSAFVAVHTYYYFTPVQLSDEAKQLLAETAPMAQLTDNGYRLIGLLAPEGVDPVAYGRCSHAIAKKYGEAYWRELEKTREDDIGRSAEDFRRRSDEAQQTCSQGKPLLPAPPRSKSADQIRPGVDFARFASAGDHTIAAVYVDRWTAVLEGGVRGTEPDIAMTVVPEYTTALSVERARLLTFAQNWLRAKSVEEYAKSFEVFESGIPKLTQFADGVMLDTMVANSIISQHLLGLQALVAREPKLDSTLAERMQRSVSSVETLPRSLGKAIVAEVQISKSVFERVSTAGFGITPNPLVNAMERLAFDRSDTLNLSAMALRDTQKAALSTQPFNFHETRAGLVFKNVGCPWLGELALVCATLERNVIGRILAGASSPQYAEYMNRTHDVRNLAAATRLTIEARRQGLNGDALSTLVANAPASMRDVFSGKPFSYDAQSGKLTVELRAKSTVLGEKSYALSLEGSRLRHGLM
ncbi:MAG: hypothetical protein EAZ43_15415 [Betaproteobacteria bacterium]|nr:MAG: hypothetical protein EAZ43_15415 [Betaproteobacteria bacterium]